MFGIILLFVTLYACVFADDIKSDYNHTDHAPSHPDDYSGEPIVVHNPNDPFDMDDGDYDNDDELGPVISYTYSAYYFI